jgi:chitinase
VVRPEDRRNFTKLLAEFRRQLDALGGRHRHYELTAFLPADPAKITAGFESGKIFRLLDFATLQGYDYHGTWELTTNHQSAVRTPAGEPFRPDFTSERAVNAWLSGGASRSKLVLGMPFYGRGWTGVRNAGRGLFQPATGPAPATFEAGYEDYKKLKTLVGAGFTLYRDDRAGFAWLFDGTTFWTFDDPRAMARKTAFVRSRELGGAMVWSLDGDDAQGSLISAIHRGLER